MWIGSQFFRTFQWKKDHLISSLTGIQVAWTNPTTPSCFRSRQTSHTEFCRSSVSSHLVGSISHGPDDSLQLLSDLHQAVIKLQAESQQEAADPRPHTGLIAVVFTLVLLHPQLPFLTWWTAETFRSRRLCIHKGRLQQAAIKTNVCQNSSWTEVWAGRAFHMTLKHVQKLHVWSHFLVWPLHLMPLIYNKKILKKLFPMKQTQTGPHVDIKTNVKHTHSVQKCHMKWSFDSVTFSVTMWHWGLWSLIGSLAVISIKSWSSPASVWGVRRASAPSAGWIQQKNVPPTQCQVFLSCGDI